MKNEKYIIEEDKKELIQIIQSIEKSNIIEYFLNFVKLYLERWG